MSERVAVVGSGLAGLTAAWLCRRAGRGVVVYEAQAGRGMDAHTLRVGDGGIVDVPLRVMSPRTWRTVLALSAEVGVATYPVDTQASFGWLDGSTWLRSGKVRLGRRELPTVASLGSINLHAAAVGVGLAQLALDRRGARPGESLADYAARRRLPRVFLRGFLLPLLTTICTCDEATLLAWPAGDLLELFSAILTGETLRRLVGGSPALVDRLAEGLEVRAPESVVSVVDEGDGVVVRTASGTTDRFDRVIVATQANHAQRLLEPAAWPREQAILARFGYDEGALVVHRDRRFMPPRRADWAPLSYQVARDLSRAMFTVWVNPIERTLAASPADGAGLVLQTWNPLFEPAPEAVLARVSMQRAVVGADSVAALAELEALHDAPGRRVFFCGSYAAAGVPLLESAARSAIAVARRIGVGAAWDPLGPER